MNPTIAYRGAAITLALVASAFALGGEVENQVVTAKNLLTSKVKEVQATVKDVLGTPFEEQVKKAMEDLKRDPRSLKLQLQVIDILVAQGDRLSTSLGKTKNADLVAIRDRVVKGLEALSATKTAEKDQYLTRAKEAKDQEWKRRYEELAQVCDRLARAYSVRAEQYKAVPITEQLLQVQTGIEYLGSVRQVLMSLRDGLNTILGEEEALRELQRLTITVSGIQSSLQSFSDVVLAGALAGEDPATSAASKREP